jgi:hypothetical protein
MHAQVAAAARERGIPVNEDVAGKNLKQIRAVYRPLGAESMQGSQVPGGDLTVGYIVMALAAEKHPLDKMTAVLARLLLSQSTRHIKREMRQTYSVSFALEQSLYVGGVTRIHDDHVSQIVIVLQRYSERYLRY